MAASKNSKKSSPNLREKIPGDLHVPLIIDRLFTRVELVFFVNEMIESVAAAGVSARFSAARCGSSVEIVFLFDTHELPVTICITE